MNAIGTSSQIRALGNCNDVVAALAESAGDLGRQVLVKKQLQPEIASRAARQLASSCSLSAWMRAIQSSISSRLEP